MDDTNAYAPPATDIRQNPSDNTGAPKLGPDEARRLYNHSRSIGALVFIWCLGVVIMLAIFIPNALAAAQQTGSNSNSVGIILSLFGAIVLLMLAGIVGCWRRDAWGRVIGQILCALMLLFFWIGTVIGIMGLIALAKSGRLFGPGRLTHFHLAATLEAYKATKSTRRQR